MWMVSECGVTMELYSAQCGVRLEFCGWRVSVV